MTAALEIRGLSAEVGGRRAVEDASMSLAPGEILGLVGANGSGKTSLARAALGLLRATAGEALLLGTPAAALAPRRRAELAAFLPQGRSVGWNLPAWRIAALGAPFASPGEARRRALAALAQVGMAAFAERGVLAVSGGERARILIARLLATQAPLLIADEPEAGLDPDAQRLVMERLAARAKEGGAVLAILHDLTLAAAFCDRIAVMAAGRIIAAGPPGDALAPQILRQAFGLYGALIETPAGRVLAARRMG